jgi:hypothetical protein
MQTIKTWQERTGNHQVRPGSIKHMMAEIADLRAALASQAESAPVAMPDADDYVAIDLGNIYTDVRVDDKWYKFADLQAALAQRAASAEAKTEAVGIVHNTAGKFWVRWMAKPEDGMRRYTAPVAATTSAPESVLRAVIEVVRQYPDFDGETPLGTMMDEALAGQASTLLAGIDSLAAGVKPAAGVPHIERDLL